MKNLIYCLACLCLALCNYSCKSDMTDKVKSVAEDVKSTTKSTADGVKSAANDVKNASEELSSKETYLTSVDAPFSVIVTEDVSRPHLPALQSFVLATSGSTWMMMGGRTNGMHRFDGYKENSFTHEDFNDSIFVCDASKCNSMSVTNIAMPYQSMFRATNLQHYQDGNDLYITGGYGENPIFNDILERWDTYDFMAKIDIAAMMSAVNNDDVDALRRSFILGQDPMVEATGGELFKMGDYFYLTVGHNFNGVFSHTEKTPNNQVYLDAVHRFQFTEVNNTLTLTNASKVTDGLADDLTQFRRRDLPVLPGVRMNNGTLEQCLTLFAGVFVSSDNKIPGLVADGAFINPIHIHMDGHYDVDNTYEQSTNIYASANFSAYDANTNTLHSTIIGGIGDGTSKFGFTNDIITINTPLGGGITTETKQGALSAPKLFGAESNTIYSNAVKVSGSDNVFDITSMTSGETMEVATFYGGIQADQPNPSGYGKGYSQASNKLWRVSIVKN